MRLRFIFLLSLMLIPAFILAQGNELAATLEVLESGVEVRRVNTSNWIEVNIEAIVGVGDVIRTDETGRARVTFFADGVDTEVLPNTEYRIEQFEGDDTSFNITAAVLIGQTVQRLNRTLDANSNYDVQTPAMILGARGTVFAVRVDEGGDRAAMLVQEGVVDATADDVSSDVPDGFGVRAEEELSDVVRATTFDELDAALDGCLVQVTTQDDVRINVRLAPSLEAQRVGTIDASDIPIFIGVTESGGWYRIYFRNGFGWVLSSTATVSSDCVGLRVFSDDHGPEDVSLYEVLGDPIDADDLAQPEATAEASSD